MNVSDPAGLVSAIRIDENLLVVDKKSSHLPPWTMVYPTQKQEQEPTG
jgi:hypothetical protein